MPSDTTRSPTGTVAVSPHDTRDVTGTRAYPRATPTTSDPSEVEFSWVDVSEVCEAALDQVSDGADRRQVGLDRAFDTRLRLVLADREELTSLLVALLTATLDHAAPGAHVSLDTTAQVARDVVAFTVSRRGPAAADATPEDPAAVHALAAMLGPLSGSLWHEHTSSGARTTLELPWGLRGTCTRAVELAMRSGVQPELIWEAPAPPPRVVLIFRDLDSGSRLGALLDAEGYDPLVVDAVPARGAEALRVRPDAVVVDSRLARELQTDLVDLVRDETGLHALPVLVTMRTADAPLAPWLTGAGRSACVAEPFDRPTVVGSLGRLLGDQLS